MNDVTPATTNCLECARPAGPEPGLETEFAVLCPECAVPLVAAMVGKLRAVSVWGAEDDEAKRAAAGQVISRADLDIDSQVWFLAWPFGSVEHKAARAALIEAAKRVIALDGEGDFTAGLNRSV